MGHIATAKVRLPMCWGVSVWRAVVWRSVVWRVVVWRAVVWRAVVPHDSPPVAPYIKMPPVVRGQHKYSTLFNRFSPASKCWLNVQLG